MSHKARLWIGVTLLLAVALNYIIIGGPIIRRGEALKVEMRSLLIKYAKSGGAFGDMQQDYLLQVFRKEQAGLDRKIVILNCASATLALLIVSWTIFGLLHRRRQ